MRLTAWVKSSALLGALFVAAWPVAAQSQQSGSGQQPGADPVADAARKARDQKKTEPKPKKVFTDDDFRAAPPAASSEKGAAAAQAGNAPATPAAKGQAKEEAPTLAQEEEKWRKRFKEMHGKIAQAEQELDVLQRELNKGQVQYYSDPQKALTEQNTRKDINEKNDKINEKKKQIEQLKQDLSNLEDELRRAGGDIGWARE